MICKKAEEQMHSEDLPLFQTKRLLIRQLTADDFDVMYAVYSDAEAMRWVDDGQPISREECIRWIEITQKNYAAYGYGMSALVLRSSGAVIGFCGLVHPGGQPEAEIKYALLRDYWGQGFASEATQGMIDYGVRTFGLRKIIATIDPDNLASQRVMAKVGMEHVETQQNEDGTFTEIFARRFGETMS